MDAPQTDRLPAWLSPNEYVDSAHPAVVGFAREVSAGAADDREVAVRLYYAVRDGIRYDPYVASVVPEAVRASATLAAGRSWCVAKAVLLAACCRSLGIGARLGYADVRNHLSTENLRRHMQTDVFYYHGYTQLAIEGRWLKATPAFNVELCEKMGLRALEFDGRQDSLYHPFDREGKRHMEYLRDHGIYDSVPAEDILACWREHYPKAIGAAADAAGGSRSGDGDFDREVERERGKS